MDTDKLKFETLGFEERKLLLQALNIPMKNMQCYYCAKRIDYKTCGIMPPISRGEIGRITCSSPLCIAEYLEDYVNTNPPTSPSVTLEKPKETNISFIQDCYQSKCEMNKLDTCMLTSKEEYTKCENKQS